MNQVARIFVVINLFLAAGFLMAAATFLKQNENWKMKHGDLEKSKSAEISGLQTQINTLNGQITALKSDLTSTEGRLAAAENDKKDAETRFKAADEAKGTAEQNLQREQGNTQSLSSNLKQLADEMKSLRENVDNYHGAMVKAQEERDAMNLEKSKLSEELAKEKDNVAAHDRTIEEMKKSLNEITAIRDAYAKMYPPPAVPNQQKVDGSVTRYDGTANVIQINRGKSHGIVLGHKLDIVRGNSFICEIEIDNVGDDYAIGHVGRVKVPGRAPQAGDSATNL